MKLLTQFIRRVTISATAASQLQFVNVLDPTRLLVQFRPLLKLWNVVPPID